MRRHEATSKEQIKIEIEALVDGIYVFWAIGTTDDPDEERKHCDDPDEWHQWDMATEEDARDIVFYFLDKGMRGGFGDCARYVYVY